MMPEVWTVFVDAGPHSTILRLSPDTTLPTVLDRWRSTQLTSFLPSSLTSTVRECGEAGTATVVLRERPSPRPVLLCSGLAEAWQLPEARVSLQTVALEVERQSGRPWREVVETGLECTCGRQLTCEEQLLPVDCCEEKSLRLKEPSSSEERGIQVECGISQRKAVKVIGTPRNAHHEFKPTSLPSSGETSKPVNGQVNEELNKRKQALSNDIEALLKSKKKLEDKNKKLEELVTALTKEEQEMGAKITTRLNRVQYLEDIKRHLQESIQNFERAAELHKHTKQELEQDIARLKNVKEETVNELREEKESLQKHISCMKENVRELHDQKQSLDKKLQEMKRQTHALREERQRREGEKQILDGKLRQMRDERHSLDEMLEEKKTKRQFLENTVQHLQNQQANLLKALQDLQSEISQSERRRTEGQMMLNEKGRESPRISNQDLMAISNQPQNVLNLAVVSDFQLPRVGHLLFFKFPTNAPRTGLVLRKVVAHHLGVPHTDLLLHRRVSRRNGKDFFHVSDDARSRWRGGYCSEDGSELDFHLVAWHEEEFRPLSDTVQVPLLSARRNYFRVSPAPLQRFFVSNLAKRHSTDTDFFQAFPVRPGEGGSGLRAAVAWWMGLLADGVKLQRLVGRWRGQKALGVRGHHGWEWFVRGREVNEVEEQKWEVIGEKEVVPWESQRFNAILVMWQ